MKKLILSLLVMWQVQGICQDSLTIYHPDYPHHIEFQFRGLLDLTDWLIYKQECYNDSSVHYYMEFIDYDNRLLQWRAPCEKGSNIYGFDCSEHIVHKTPTAEGFFDWLVEKYKIELINKNQ